METNGLFLEYGVSTVVNENNVKAVLHEMRARISEVIEEG